MNNNFKKPNGNQVKLMLGAGTGLLAAAVVYAFIAMLSWQFFNFIFPNQFYAPLGFGLTGGSALFAIIIIKSGHANTEVRKVSVLAMLLVGTVGELWTAGYGVQIENLIQQGATPNTDFALAMANVIKVLGFIHALIMFAFYLFDDIKAWFADDDGDGIPNIIDHVDNRTSENKGQSDLKQPIRDNHRPMVTLSSDTEKRDLNPS